MRSILALIFGYLSLLLVGAATFTAAYFVIGTDLAFKARSFEISTLMAVCGLATGVAGGFVGGAIWRAVSRSTTAPRAFVALTFAITLMSGLPMLLGDRVREGRTSDITRLSAMTRAVHPAWFTLLLPVAQAAGVLGMAMTRRV